jgi:predicted alpha/beta hydrolase
MIDILCGDGFKIKGEIFTSNVNCKKGKIIIINSATGVCKNLYRNYAIYLAQNGFDTITYDYRGIADSRPQKLQGFEASFTTWGQMDFTAVTKYVKEKLPNHKILVMGHSIGGTIIGMSENCSSIDGIINIGAQTSYYKDWDKHKYKLYFLWHVIFPLITNIYGYFPGKKLKLLEDIPKGVIKQWNSRKKNPSMVNQLEKNGHKVFYNLFRGKLLTLAIEDDVIGTKKAIKRVYNLFTSADREIEFIKPKDVGVSEIGHFGFFSRKFENTLWKKSIEWYEKI